MSTISNFSKDLFQPSGSKSYYRYDYGVIKIMKYPELQPSFEEWKKLYGNGLRTEYATPYQGKMECNPCLNTRPSLPNLEMTTNSPEVQLSNNPKCTAFPSPSKNE